MIDAGSYSGLTGTSAPQGRSALLAHENHQMRCGGLMFGEMPNRDLPRIS